MDQSYPRAKGEVDLLLGIIDTLKLITAKHISISDTLALLPTCYGHIPCGQEIVRNITAIPEQSHSTYLTSAEVLNKTLEKMWEIEKFPLDETPSSLTRDEARAIERINECMKYDEKERRFVTGLLWRDQPDLCNNYLSAKARLDTLLRRLRANPELKKAYVDAMREYMDRQVVEIVIDPRAMEPSRKDLYFLPHRAVYDETRVSTKCRIVFDASAKTSNKLSLNDNLVCGPALQLSILAIEVRFRTQKYILIGDIGKMFLQIRIQAEDRDYLRFLWKDPDSKGEPQIWRWNSLIFGAADSPFQAIKAIKTLVADRLKEPNLTDLDRKVCEVLDQNTYVDDLIITSNSCDEAYQLYQGVTELLARANFQVKKWASNSTELLKRMDPDSLAPTEVDLHSSEDNVISADTSTLGVQWEPRTDRIHYSRCKNIAKENENTMTSVASLLAKPFDPLGLLSPFILQARFIMKECHVERLKWQDALPDNLRDEWLKWVQQLKNLDQVQFPRHVPLDESSTIVIFCDTSENGYGAVAYCRTQIDPKNWESQVLCARARVAPSKRLLTIPKKELAACLTAAELGQFLHEELKIEKSRFRFFSDSNICLFQLTKPLNVLTPFVANRVEKIRNWGFSFEYVNTKENPGDICSRGSDLLDLNSSKWRNGPSWLSKPQEEWPQPQYDFSQIDKSEGFKKQHIFSFQTDVIQNVSLTTPRFHLVNKARKVGNEEVWPTLDELLGIGQTERIDFEDYYSSYSQLIKRTSWIFFVIRKWKHLSKTEPDPNPSILPGEIDRTRSLHYWTRLVQSRVYQEEIMNLRNGAPLSLKSKLLQLDPFLDEEGILRVGGRLGFSNLTFGQKHPIILPKSHPFVHRLILHFHQENNHIGVDQLHFFLREKYWIIKSRQLIRKILHTCVKCRRVTSRPTMPIMGNMPEGRLRLSNDEPPWTHVGGDLTGAIQLKKVGRRTVTPEQAYIVLYTCMTTRSIYLDLMLSNKAEDFLLSFKRLCGDVGTPQFIYSDQAGYFSRAKEELQESFSALNECMNELQEKGKIVWKMNASKAPHEAGVWERLVKSTKHILLKICRNSLLNYVEFQTVLKETQALLNDRPLVALSEEAMDVITPSMLTHGKKLM